MLARKGVAQNRELLGKDTIKFLLSGSSEYTRERVEIVRKKSFALVKLAPKTISAKLIEQIPLWQGVYTFGKTNTSPFLDDLPALFVAIRGFTAADWAKKGPFLTPFSAGQVKKHGGRGVFGLSSSLTLENEEALLMYFRLDYHFIQAIPGSMAF
jgi:hypothetical protein